MRYILPQIVKNKLAERTMRLHHLLWHTVRNNWHKFTQEEQDVFRTFHPDWVPIKPRFIRQASGLQIVNNNAGEAFLYMHRQMIASVNQQLAAINEPAIVPWTNIPAPDDVDYPVPGRNKLGDKDKSDDFYQKLLSMEEELLDPERLRRNSLAQIGAFIESSIHDPLHRRWAAESAGQMENFPELDPHNINPFIDTSYDSANVDWLRHPYSSHVNSDFWKLHGWCDQFIERWRDANNVTNITWTDTWMGGAVHHDGMNSMPINEVKEDLSHHNHNHLEHGGHSEHELLKIFNTLNSFEGCQIGFDYLEKNNIPLPELN